MAEKILYGHSSGTNGTGYRILSRSVSDKPVSDLEVNALIQKLKLRPAILGKDMGWFWLPFSDQVRVLAAVLVYTSENGVQTLQFRLVFFGLDECDLFHWQPFHFLDEMRSQTRWEVEGDGVLPELVQRLPEVPSIAHTNSLESFAIGWKDSATVADRVFAAFLSSCPLKARSKIEFLAPELSDRNNPLIVYRASSSPLRLSSTKDARDGSLQRTFNLKTSVLSGGIALLFGFAVSFAFLKTKLEEKNALLADRESELRQFEENSASPIFSPAVRDQTNMVRNLSDEFAKSTLVRLRTLFGELHSESQSAAVDQEIVRILHYLDNKGASNDYGGLVESGLKAWIKFEQQRNSEQNRMAEQDRIAKQLHESLYRLRSLVHRMNEISSSRSIPTSARENSARETAEEINKTIAKTGELVETLRELTIRSTDGVDTTPSGGDTH